MSWPKTLADSPEIGRALQPVPGEPWRPSATVRAPCCGRLTSADSVIDVREVPGTIVRGGNRQPPRDHGLICDGCWTLMVRSPENNWTWSRLARAIGAPADELRVIRAKEMVEERARSARDRNESIRPLEEYGRALAELPRGTVKLPGTERP